MQIEAEKKDEKTAIRNDDPEYKELLNYICKLFRVDKVSYLITKQIADYTDKYKYSYKGIRKTLYYFFEIQENAIDNMTHTIGIVPYVYDEARKFYQEIYEANCNNERANIEEHSRKVKIRPQDRTIPFTTNIEEL